ncbi:MAG: hypothetical protein FJ316_09510 [SAR202 cluster bacterium]|nr:hypothetical protein [SAR202 cluster bacterium]
MASLEERVSRQEGTLEQMNERLGGLEANIRELRAEMHEGFRDMRAELRSNTRWIIGLIIVQWVTVMAAVLGALLTR